MGKAWETACRHINQKALWGGVDDPKGDAPERETVDPVVEGRGH